MNKTTVIYHRADFDGLFCREIAHKFMPDATLIGWDYGDPTPAKSELDGTEQLYMLDISVSDLMDHPKLIWIDHHVTAMEKYPSEIDGYRINGVAACRLAWQWFSEFEMHDPEAECHAMLPGSQFPTKQQYIDRKVSEPWAVRLAGEYDIWDKRDPNAELFQHGLRSAPLTDGIWDELLQPKNIKNIVEQLLEGGRVVQYAKTQENDSIIKAFGFTIQFEGFCLLACNAARYNSQLFTAGLKPEHDGCLGFNWDGQQWRVSLYTDKPGVDLSPVAVKYGGGGHRGACGFRTKTLPFLA